jgi:hypothetical protein
MFLFFIFLKNQQVFIKLNSGRNLGLDEVMLHETLEVEIG